MKRSTANKKKQKATEVPQSTNEVEKEEAPESPHGVEKEEAIEQFILRQVEELDESEDLDLMSPAEFIGVINESYVLRKHTGRSRLKFHPKKITIKNYW
ncbi:hypothetical protein EBR43_13485 [bacterium]|nr:hypothetical protein [bacterium]